MAWGPVLWLVALVLWATWTPFLPRFTPWEVTLAPPRNPFEVAGNLLLFLPLGFVSGRALSERSEDGASPGLVAGLVVALLCASVETGQIAMSDRIVSPYDVALNVSGGWSGVWAGCRVAGAGPEARLWADRGLALLLVAAFVGVLAIFAARVPAASDGLVLSGWRPDYPVRVGDEAGGGRAYRGDVRDARICAGSAGDGVCVSEEADAEDRRDLVQAAERSQTLVIEGVVRSGSSRQFGPTRIITFSDGHDVRNATLAQSGDDLVLRLRTPMGGPNGTRVHFRMRDAVPLDEPVAVAARFRSGDVELTVAGDSVDRSEVFPMSREWALAWLVAGELHSADASQLLWSGLAGSLLVLFPVGAVVGRLGADAALTSVALAGGAAGAGTITLFCLGAFGGVGAGEVLLAGAAAGAGGVIGRRDGRVWHHRYRDANRRNSDMP